MKVEVQGVDVINLSKFGRNVNVTKTLLLDEGVIGFEKLTLRE